MSQAQQPESKPTENPIIEYFKRFSVLKETRSEYWGLQLVNFLDMTAYFALYGIVIVFLSEDFGFGDVSAGYIYAAFTLGTTVCLWFCGFFTDWLGIRWTIFLSMLALLVTRIAVTWAGLAPDSQFEAMGEAINYKGILAWEPFGFKLAEMLHLSADIPFRSYFAAIAIILMAPGMAMVQTMLQAGNRRFTTERSRGAGFNLWYMFMNVGAVCGGLMIDLVRNWLELDNAYIVGFSIFTSIACILVAVVTIRREDQLHGPGEEPIRIDSGGPRKRPWEIAWSVVTRPVFWRFMVLVIALLGVRAVFLYLHLLCPKFWLRVIGEEALIGSLQAFNPLLVVIGLILLIPILHRYTVYGMLTYGAIVSALSLFILAIPMYGNWAYIPTIAFLLLLTVGEILWSPRLQEYTAAIAPPGQEGAYFGLSLFPWFFAKFLVSTSSGHLLAYYVPESVEGEPSLGAKLAAGEVPFLQSPSFMWIILGCCALAGPLLALLLRGWFTKGARWDKGEEQVESTDVPDEPEMEPSTE